MRATPPLWPRATRNENASQDLLDRSVLVVANCAGFDQRCAPQSSSSSRSHLSFPLLECRLRSHSLDATALLLALRFLLLYSLSATSLLSVPIGLCSFDGGAVSLASVAAGVAGALGADQLRRAAGFTEAIAPDRLRRLRLLLRALPRSPQRSRLDGFSWLLLHRILLKFAPFWKRVGCLGVIVGCSSGGGSCGSAAADSWERWGDTWTVSSSCGLDCLLYCQVSHHDLPLIWAFLCENFDFVCFCVGKFLLFNSGVHQDWIMITFLPLAAFKHDF